MADAPFASAIRFDRPYISQNLVNRSLTPTGWIFVRTLGIERVMRTHLLAPLAATVVLGLAGPGLGQGLKLNKKLDFAAKLAVIDGRAADQYEFSVRLQPDYEPDDDKAEAIPKFRSDYSGEYLAMAKVAAETYDIPEDLFLRLVQQESGFNQGAVSAKGAIGLAQLMPGTAEALGVDPNDPEENLKGGARYLKMQYDKFGSWRLALAAYNAGPEAVEAHNGIPPYDETENYVKVILGS
jgi:soluble lytic murein transglycosylase-like protein